MANDVRVEDTSPPEMLVSHSLDSPVPVTEPPEDYHKLRRHKNPKYEFEPCPGYERPSL